MNMQDIFEHLNFGMELSEVRFDIYQGTQLIESNVQRLPEQFAKQNFIGIIQQLSNAPSPMRAEMHVKCPIYDDNGNYIRTLDNYIEYKNKLFED